MPPLKKNIPSIVTFLKSAGLIRSHWKGIVIVVETVVIVLFLYQAATGGMSRPAVGVAVPATKDRAVESAPRENTHLATCSVKTYRRKTMVPLHLPQGVIANPDDHVLDASRIAADDHPQTVIPILDVRTGITRTFVVRDALPLFAWDTSGELGIYAGFWNGQRAMRLQARQSLFDIKAAHFGGMASFDQPLGTGAHPDTFVGLGAWGGWK